MIRAKFNLIKYGRIGWSQQIAFAVTFDLGLIHDHGMSNALFDDERRPTFHVLDLIHKIYQSRINLYLIAKEAEHALSDNFYEMRHQTSFTVKDSWHVHCVPYQILTTLFLISLLHGQ